VKRVGKAKLGVAGAGLDVALAQSADSNCRSWAVLPGDIQKGKYTALVSDMQTLSIAPSTW
jgi:hypothetical protein